jgi:hypothetical protein
VPSRLYIIIFYFHFSGQLRNHRLPPPPDVNNSMGLVAIVSIRSPPRLPALAPAKNYCESHSYHKIFGGGFTGSPVFHGVWNILSSTGLFPSAHFGTKNYIF